MPKPFTSVLRRSLLDVIDDQYLHWSLPRFQLQTELLLKRSE